jgi:hypothetical protein
MRRRKEKKRSLSHFIITTSMVWISWIQCADNFQQRLNVGAGLWPYFHNTLDIAGINAWIIYRKAIGSSRRQFILVLSKELTKSSNNVPSCADPQKQEKLTCEVKAKCNRNRTRTTCIKCKRPVCGPCTVTLCCECSQ